MELDYDSADYFDRSAASGTRLTGYYDYEADLELHLRNFRDNLDVLSGVLPRGRLLDVGCATGHFALAARDAGYEVTGVDMSQAAARTAHECHGLDVCVGDVREIRFEQPFDGVTMWETIEHLPDPHPVLERLRCVLRAGGVIAIGTGDNRSPLARLLGRRWWYVNPPDHCIYYNRRALRALLERSGFEVIGFRRIARHWVSSRNAAMKLLRTLGAPGPRSLALAARMPDFALPVYHGTTLVALARRHP